MPRDSRDREVDYRDLPVHTRNRHGRSSYRIHIDSPSQGETISYTVGLGRESRGQHTVPHLERTEQDERRRTQMQGDRRHGDGEERQRPLVDRRAREHPVREQHREETYQYQAELDENDERVRAWMDDVERGERELHDNLVRSGYYRDDEVHGYSEDHRQPNPHRHSEGHGHSMGSGQPHHPRHHDDTQARDRRQRDRRESDHQHQHREHRRH
ncbi:hypothetical protein CHU98_g5034 [Xylaria longipes]|nr:hypothetical protein CHU98_g5034 [Xylaria longipes]